jgi:hypothetical protein
MCLREDLDVKEGGEEICKRGVVYCNHVENICNLGTTNFLFITFDAELLVT